jgi:hypothetical protein
MNYELVKQCVKECPELVGMDEGSLATLFWRGKVQQLPLGDVIYEENTMLDDTFGVLLSGYLEVEKQGQALGQISGPQIFGEMAYFTSSHSRTATVRSGSEDTVVLKVQMGQAELAGPKFTTLRQFLGREAWDRFVSTTQT